MVLTVKNLVVIGILTANGHIITGGVTPTISVGDAACRGASATLQGNDESGTITIIAGDICHSAGILATVSFYQVYGITPHVLLTPDNADSAELRIYKTTSGVIFSISSIDQPKTGTRYIYDYFIRQ